MVENIIIEGSPFSGKSTLISLLKEKTNKNLIENGFLKDQYLKHWSLWNKSLNNREKNIIILLECEPEILLTRSNKNFTYDELFLIRYRYRQLSAFYGNNIHILDTSKNSAEITLKEALSIINENNKEFLVPDINEITEEEYLNFPLIIEGESKIIRQFNKKFQIIKYKPTVHSFKQNRSGIVEGTEIERMLMTKNIIDIFSRFSIKHSYFFIGNKFILNLTQKNLPPIEIIVKKCFVGSDYVRYYNLENCLNRFGKPVVNKNKFNEYNKYIVRFDYRNPNFNPETKKPLGDILLCDDLADEFINVEVAKKTALKIFKILDENFKKINLYFEDVCFMLDVNGDTMYGEVSQDCGRYKYLNNGEIVDLDKDVWRNWESFENVREKYKRIREMIEKFVKEEFYDMK
jgi:phosphoribosylaminoimidazole-succinocarboxamide synthase